MVPVTGPRSLPLKAVLRFLLDLLGFLAQCVSGDEIEFWYFWEGAGGVDLMKIYPCFSSTEWK